MLRQAIGESSGRRAEVRCAVASRSPRLGAYDPDVTVLVVLFWVSLVALAWTHVLYPALASSLARIAPRRAHAAAETSRRSR